jgi:hypothetical protein
MLPGSPRSNEPICLASGEVSTGCMSTGEEENTERNSSYMAR